MKFVTNTNPICQLSRAEHLSPFYIDQGNDILKEKKDARFRELKKRDTHPMYYSHDMHVMVIDAPLNQKS